MRDPHRLLRLLESFAAPAGRAGAELMDDWFRRFDEAGLAFLYQEQKASGEHSTFFKLVRRDSD